MTSRSTKPTVVVLIVASIVLVWRLTSFVASRLPAAAVAAAPAPTFPLPTDAPPVARAAAHKTGTVDEPDAQTIDMLLTMQEERETRPWGRDPFEPVSERRVVSSRPVSRSVDGAPDWKLSGVSTIGTRRIAILSGRVVGEGDVIDDHYRVTKIGSAEVTIREGPLEHHFYLGVAGAETRKVGTDK